MATAAKNYRKTGRLPRATTKLSTFMNGMFYTEQIVPDGYAKTLINYDIDYTGNCLKPKMGRIQYDDIDNEYYKWLDLTYQANVNVFDNIIHQHPLPMDQLLRLCTIQAYRLLSCRSQEQTNSEEDQTLS